MEDVDAPELSTPEGEKITEDFKNAYEGRTATAILYIVDGRGKHGDHVYRYLDRLNGDLIVDGISIIDVLREKYDV